MNAKIELLSENTKRYLRQSKLHQVFNDLHIFHKDPAWRAVDPPQPGEFNGLPGSRGFLVATNGVLAICTTGGLEPFYGHLDNWVADRPPTTTTGSSSRKRPLKTAEDILEEFGPPQT